MAVQAREGLAVLTIVQQAKNPCQVQAISLVSTSKKPAHRQQSQAGKTKNQSST
jgi:hypothetical protein